RIFSVMVNKIVSIVLCFFLAGCNFRSPKADELLIIVNADYGQDIISSVRLDLRKITPSKSPIGTFREEKESLIYIDNLTQSELVELLDAFSHLNTRGRLVPSDDKRVYYYNLNDDLK